MAPLPKKKDSGRSVASSNSLRQRTLEETLRYCVKNKVVEETSSEFSCESDHDEDTGAAAAAAAVVVPAAVAEPQPGTSGLNLKTRRRAAVVALDGMRRTYKEYPGSPHSPVSPHSSTAGSGDDWSPTRQRMREDQRPSGKQRRYTILLIKCNDHTYVHDRVFAICISLIK